MSKAILKALVPPLLSQLRQMLANRGQFRGDYASWAEAETDSVGYREDIIVERVLAATLAVQAGDAAFERDSVLFANASYEYPLLAALHTVASSRGGTLSVLDFGGALGSTYWRHRSMLCGLKELWWDVVEQPSFVRAGRQELREAPLRFFESLEVAEEATPHGVLLVSTTLQYLASPYETLERWTTRGFPYLLFNNLPLHRSRPDRLMVQRVPPAIYPASYPVWFFNREQFLARLSKCYTILMEYASEAVWPIGLHGYPSTGLLMQKKTL